MLATDEHRENHRNQPENKKGTITDAHKNISRLLHTTPQINHPASTPLKKPPAAAPPNLPFWEEQSLLIIEL